MNWKLVTVVLVSLILLVICYLTLDLQKYFVSKKVQEPVHDLAVVKKIKIDIPKEEDLRKIKIPEDHIAYYFPSECPSYKQEFFLIDTEEGLEKYYVPEEKHMIIVKKDHRWTKEPDFVHWKYEAKSAN
jgi:hypothetical protein